MSRNHSQRPAVTEQFDPNAISKPRKGKRIALGLGTAATLAGGFVGYNMYEDIQEQRHENRVEAVHSIDGTENEVLILAKGVTLRETPYGSVSSDPNMNNEIKQTNEALLLRGPNKSSEHEGWVSFVILEDGPGAESTFNSIDERSSKTVWVHKAELDKQGYVSAYDIAPIDGLEVGATVETTVTSGGALQLDGFESDGLGVATYMSEEELQMLDFVINGD